MATELGKFPDEVAAQTTPLELATWAVILRRRDEREEARIARAVNKGFGGK